eukprot:SM000050S17059  [mRNA]  locus=s50:678957:680752:- [translate_table: standard]
MDDLCGLYFAGKKQLASVYLTPPDADCHEELDEDDDAAVPCPYCFEDFGDVPLLCQHLQSGLHSESKAVVCPICNDRVAKDVLGHIIKQHGPLRQDEDMELLQGHKLAAATGSRGLRRLSTASHEGRDLKDLAGLLFIRDKEKLAATQQARQQASDALFSSFVDTLTSDEGLSQATGTVAAAADTAPRDEGVHASLSIPVPVESRVESDVMLEEAATRAAFVQQLVLSTIFGHR